MLGLPWTSLRARWSEIDDNRWNVPAEHMKSGLARTIPLSTAAVALLDSIRPARAAPDRLIFGSRRRGGSGRQTDGAMQTLIRNKLALGYTVHGFRSSFMDWVAEVHPQRLLEAERALDHQIGNQVQRAYLRTDFFEQRREPAELWVGHLRSGICAGKSANLSSNAKLHRVLPRRRSRQTSD
jgi:integrase